MWKALALAYGHSKKLTKFSADPTIALFFCFLHTIFSVCDFWKMMNFFIIALMFYSTTENFRSSQMSFERVNAAYKEKEHVVNQLLEDAAISSSELELYLRAFKKEGNIEIWAKNRRDRQFKLLKTYAICHASGNVGPKRKEGDRQVPEGFYHINRFNPNSRFHLSLGINYPNKSDKVLSDKTKPGGDIFIHGGCVSIGCLAMTDDAMKEIYILAVEAKNNGQKTIPVTFFPFKMSHGELERALIVHKPKEDVKKLWNELREAYVLFENNRSLPKILFESNGSHRIL
jgi:murein L,D-transpeptidase YafK